ncbi:uncharacterized protein BHQ10_003157 [Talaromyces amestolkiae]|uniref:BZIP domain-containing protein n=1 Tax=Talaromyces amestolkiae TaxID=1196081 RepID=A0A364KUA9_TALAM|nr:uncharacterized protein BHQ10_003157 [Talaromyces amestolkiae]RAO67145.1 hypothetical protein BHQ10_003157 [Talaromyces amestolkiae]
MSLSLSPIDLISSSSYPIPAQLDQRQRAVHASTLYGGLTLLPYDDDTTTPITMPTDEKPKSKRNTNKNSNRKSEDDNKVSKRKRGRPRVLDKDENAAEVCPSQPSVGISIDLAIAQRRRTQIRLAQRAYRSRKEATISSLSKKLAELDAAIRDMNTTVGSFRDELMGSGLLLQQTTLTYGLQRLVQKSDALVKLSRNEEYDSANTSPIDETASNNSSSVEVGDALFVDQSPEITDNLDEFNFTLYTSTDNASSMNFDSLFQGYGLDSVQQQAPTTLAGNANTQLASSFAGSFPQGVANTDTNTTSWLQHSTIPPPSTYSFNESSFVRRLRRQCAEHAYRILTDPNTDPKDIIRKYRFSLCFKNKDALIDRFYKVITSSSSSSTASTTTTSASTAAAYTLGNAGIHYPRPNQQPIPEMTFSSPTELYPVSKFIGPWPFHQADAPHEFTSIDECVSARGMAGDWFDSNDVEGYLREQGIQVDTQASFVTLPDDVPSSSPSSRQVEYVDEKKNPATTGDDVIDPSLGALTVPTEIKDSSKVVHTDSNTKQPTRIFDMDMFLSRELFFSR